MRKKALIILDLSNIPIEFRDVWDEWLDYKKEIGDYYKTQKGMDIQFSHLLNMSNGIPEIAKEIIYQSIERNWKGLFRLKNEHISNCRQTATTPDIYEVSKRILECS